MKNKSLLIYALALLCMLASCKDDDNFTLSPSHLLTFSVDTIDIDTVFSNVPTTTKSFWVYNRSGDGIRCKNVRLENGGATGFRVNVDGQYLGQLADFAITDIEIRNKDSVRVFVELTSPENGQLEPQLCQDNLIFTLESGVEQKVNLSAYTWDAVKYTDLHVSKDSLISSLQKPIIIYGGIEVDSGATLSIAAGTTLYFHNDAGMAIHGTLKTLGRPGSEVVLRGDRIDHMFDYLTYDRVPGQWQGLHFYASSYENELTYTDIHSAYNGVIADSSDVKKNKLAMANSTIHNCQGFGMHATSSRLILNNCQFTNTLADCVRLDGGRVSMNNCTLAQFYPFDGARLSALHFTSIQAPLEDLSVANTLITGYADDVLTGEHGDSTETFNYLFDHCIIRTPKVATRDSVNFMHVTFEDVKDTIHCGEKHFVNIDTKNLVYDFDLDSVSSAIGKADSLTALPVDRKGRQRDKSPDVGAYEWMRKSSSTLNLPKKQRYGKDKIGNKR